jgi:hypothetical protein
MGWEIAYEHERDRDIGYGVPAECDHPDCHAEIDRGLSYVCGGEPYGGEVGCGLFFCEDHLLHGEPIDPDASEDGYDDEDAQAWAVKLNDQFGGCFCEQCQAGAQPFEPKPDVQEWMDFKATDPSWAEWRAGQAAGHRRRSA